MELKAVADLDGTTQKNKQKKQQHFHVLAVDDSLIDRKLLEKLLTVSSYQVTCVDSGDKALEYLGLHDNDSSTTTSFSRTSSTCLSSQQEVRPSKINLIMTDYSMPGMSGYDLLKRVKGSSWKDVPVVVMSSENVPSRINMCLEGGAEEFLLKPVKLSDLRKLQSQLLGSLSHHSHTQKIDDHLTNNDNPKSIDDDNDNARISTNANKRKAMSPEQLERRPKMKELAVL
ncbi:hypothetical protein RJ639_032284 [Escallonia herrerae]|uniref:Response regulatory domain-containing protein n=1 Tax=Escallonia herrerae TaxID=1293975 RepID=A0AA89BK67_9ASTE|nr:hypothetical protein RJ639_032284 [Escallonia herrerae]